MRPRSLTAIEAHEAIGLLIERPATLRLTSHARERMRERRISLDDVVRALRRGTVQPQPMWDEVHSIWRYEVRHCGPDNDSVTVVVAISDTLVVVTVHD